jgi:single-strand DNA-binding protein
MSVNKVILLGNVGANPVIRTTQDGKKIATFSLATSDKWKDRSSGEFREKTEWHRIVVFSEGLVGIIEKYIHKGTKIFIEGTLQTRKWTGNDGVEKYTTEVVLQGFNNKLEIVEQKKDGDGNGHESSHYDDSSIENIADDDIPF